MASDNDRPSLDDTCKKCGLELSPDNKKCSGCNKSPEDCEAACLFEAALRRNKNIYGSKHVNESIKIKEQLKMLVPKIETQEGDNQ